MRNRLHKTVYGLLLAICFAVLLAPHVYAADYEIYDCGWQYRSGYWYYFIDGEKCDPGWFEDEDGHKYYFDSKSRMKTGYIRVDGEEYFLNDGTYEEVPFGALLESNGYSSGLS